MAGFDLDLPLRAVGCRHWRWMPGMHGADEGDPEHVLVCGGVVQAELWDRQKTRLPVWHPATLGCLLALVREAWDRPDTYACNMDGYDGQAWICIVDDVPGWPYEVAHFDGLTEAEALVVALEAAP